MPFSMLDVEAGLIIYVFQDFGFPWSFSLCIKPTEELTGPADDALRKRKRCWKGFYISLA